MLYERINKKSTNSRVKRAHFLDPLFTCYICLKFDNSQRNNTQIIKKIGFLNSFFTHEITSQCTHFSLRRRRHIKFLLLHSFSCYECLHLKTMLNMNVVNVAVLTDTTATEKLIEGGSKKIALLHTEMRTKNE